MPLSACLSIYLSNQLSLLPYLFIHYIRASLSLPLALSHFSLLSSLSFKKNNAIIERHAVENEHGEGKQVGTIALQTEAAKNDPRLKALNKKFGMLHGISSVLNLTSVCCGVYHLWFLAGLLRQQH